MKFVLASLVLLAGCSSINGVFDVQEGDCSITGADADRNGQTEVEGTVYVRRGDCDDSDRASFQQILQGR